MVMKLILLIGFIRFDEHDEDEDEAAHETNSHNLRND